MRRIYSMQRGDQYVLLGQRQDAAWIPQIETQNAGERLSQAQETVKIRSQSKRRKEGEKGEKIHEIQHERNSRGVRRRSP